MLAVVDLFGKGREVYTAKLTSGKVQIVCVLLSQLLRHHVPNPQTCDSTFPDAIRATGPEKFQSGCTYFGNCSSTTPTS